MEQEEQKARHSSGIQNYYYGGVSKVINLKLTADDLRAFADSHVFNGSVGQLIEHVERIVDGHGTTK